MQLVSVAEPIAKPPDGEVVAVRTTPTKPSVVLPLTVQLGIESVPVFHTPPPAPGYWLLPLAELPLTVQLVIESLPQLYTPPPWPSVRSPPWLKAELPVTVQLVIESVLP